jgi:hypothetical protein
MMTEEGGGDDANYAVESCSTEERQQQQQLLDDFESSQEIFKQHIGIPIQSIFDNRHHDLNYVDEEDGDCNKNDNKDTAANNNNNNNNNSVEEERMMDTYSLGGSSKASKGEGSIGSVRTKEELRMSLIARRRRLAMMESAMDGECSLDMSLRLRNGGDGGADGDGGSVLSSLVDSIVSLNDSIQGSLLSKESLLSKGTKDTKKKKRQKKKDKSSSSSKKHKKKKKNKDKKKKSSKSKRKKKNHDDDDYDDDDDDDSGGESKIKKSKKKKSKKTTKKSHRHHVFGSSDSSSTSSSKSSFSLSKINAGDTNYIKAKPPPPSTTTTFTYQSKNNNMMNATRQATNNISSMNEQVRQYDNTRMHKSAPATASAAGVGVDHSSVLSKSMGHLSALVCKVRGMSVSNNNNNNNNNMSKLTVGGGVALDTTHRTFGRKSNNVYGNREMAVNNIDHHRRNQQPRGNHHDRNLHPMSTSRVSPSLIQKQQLEHNRLTSRRGGPHYQQHPQQQQQPTHRGSSVPPPSLRSNNYPKRVSSQTPNRRFEISNSSSRQEMNGISTHHNHLSYRQSLDVNKLSSQLQRSQQHQGRYRSSRLDNSHRTMTTTKTALPSSSKNTTRQQLQYNNNSSTTTSPASYEYGDEARRQDMNIEIDPNIAIKHISALKLGESAFIKRTTGQWTYAIVKDISVDDNITFIVDKLGCVKSYKMKYWYTHIRTMKK